MSKTVLVVDDDPIVLDVVAHILTKHGFKVLPASGGETALQICAAESGPIDLLLTDIDMPRMNGRELARCLAQHRPEVPVLFMTGLKIETKLSSDLKKAPELDGHAIIWKPFQAKELIETINELTSDQASA